MDQRIRPLTEDEIASLEKALGKPVDRKYLVHWMTYSIAVVVRFANYPTPRQVRNDFLQIERDGRRWLRSIENSKSAAHLATRLDEVQVGH